MHSFSLDIGKDTTVINEITTVPATTSAQEELEDTTTDSSESFNDPRAIQFSSDDNSLPFNGDDEVEDITQAFEITFERRRPQSG